MTVVTNEIPPVVLGLPLDEETLKRAKAIRWQWYLLHNRVRNSPWTADTDDQLARCTEVIAIIDAILAAQPTVH